MYDIISLDSKELSEIKDIARELNTHYHVDAAWGGGALLMIGGKEMLKGIEKADSVSFDAHKLLYAPNSMGICLFRSLLYPWLQHFPLPCKGCCRESAHILPGKN